MMEQQQQQNINEKDLQHSETNQELAFLFHTLWSIDHYPNFMLKQHLSFLDRFLDVLKVKQQEAEKAIQTIREREKQFLDAKLSKDELCLSSHDFPSIFDSCVLSALQKANPKTSLLSLLYEEGTPPSNVFSFPLFRPEFCSRLITEAEEFCERAKSAGYGSQLGMEKGGGLLLSRLGYLPLVDFISRHVVLPLASVLYSDTGGASLDFQHSYILKYRPPVQQETRKDDQQLNVKEKRRSSLDRHTDDSDVTLNICLIDGFVGGNLVFAGLRNTSSERSSYHHFTLPHNTVGRALLHAGQHIHSVQPPLSQGTRYTLIMWLRSSQYRSNRCPCCMIHNRSRCICTAEYN